MAEKTKGSRSTTVQETRPAEQAVPLEDARERTPGNDPDGGFTHGEPAGIFGGGPNVGGPRPGRNRE